MTPEKFFSTSFNVPLDTVKILRIRRGISWRVIELESTLIKDVDTPFVIQDDDGTFSVEKIPVGTRFTGLKDVNLDTEKNRQDKRQARGEQ